jgi:hypothetical protein
MLTATVMLTAQALTNTQSAHDGEKGVKDEKNIIQRNINVSFGDG